VACPSTSANTDSLSKRIALAVAVLLAAIALSMIFWWPLWTGGGLVGSDIYAYFLPQKAFFAEELHAGRLPVWNNRIGWGYPQIAESQTGVFYPLHWPLYFALNLNTAYSASQLLHYVIAFVFTWLYARRLGLAPWGGALAGLVYTYGWFPSRICLEWAIVGGAWFPAALWLAESLIQTRLWRYGLWITVVLALQMLAGHFTLAFVTQVSLAAYVPLRLWFAGADVQAASATLRKRLTIGLALAVAGGFLLAAVQLLPTWELKQQSQRKGVSDEHDPNYGYLPIPYLTQVVAPWYWYPDESTFRASVRAGGSRTNRVEAHLYFGLVPLAISLWGAWSARRSIDRRFTIWLLFGVGAAIYSTGVFIAVTRHLPGFSFFEGPARFGIITTFAVALWAGLGLDRLLRRGRALRKFVLCLLIFGATITDLWIVSREVTFAFLVDRPPLADLEASPLRKLFASTDAPVRVFSPGKNLPALLGISTLPTYLGLGPAAYFDPDRSMPGAFDYQSPPSEAQIDWLRRAGVTHLLSFVPLDRRSWPVTPEWQGPDLFLNRALARGGNEPLYLYALDGSRGRVAWEELVTGPTPQLVKSEPVRVEITTDAKRNGRLILTELSFPGWTVTVDGYDAQPQVVEGVFRGVTILEGNHSIVWTYRPAPLYWGGVISFLMVVGLLAIGHIRFWHPHWLTRSIQSEFQR